MAELEFSVLSRQCLDRRIPDATRLQQEIQVFEEERNQGQATINRQFTNRDARVKLHRLYPSTSG